jgi:hypothetical protein
LKLEGRVEPDHTIRVRVPADVGEGPAEVIVLLPEDVGERPALSVVLESLEDLGRPGRRKPEIDRAIEAERAAWNS